MGEKLLIRIGTIYIPVTDVELSTSWYVTQLGAELSYKDEDKAILNMANQSIFLVKSSETQNTNFLDIYGEERFSFTFEVNGLGALEALHSELSTKGVCIGAIENRGHGGRNFIFSDIDGNKFDVWSELSPTFKENISMNKK